MSLRACVMLVSSLLALSSCGQGPSQLSHYVADPKFVSNDKVYALPRGVLTLSAKAETTGPSTKVTIAAPVVTLYPDSHARFATEWLESSMATDHFTFQIGADGLLTSSSVINKDETAQIIGKVIEIAKQAAIDAIQLESLLPGETPTPPPACLDVNTTIQLDPFLTPKRSFGNGCFSVAVEKLDGDGLKPISNRAVEDIAKDCAGGVCARLPLPVKISVRGVKGAVKDVSGEFVAVLPDPGTIVSYEVTRGPCIQRQTDFAFTSGMLTKVELQKPSEILGCLEIPLSILKAIGEIPGSILQAKIKVINDDAGLVNAQAQYLQAMTTMMNNQNALLKALAAK